jgi:hypothetical protein
MSEIKKNWAQRHPVWTVLIATIIIIIVIPKDIGKSNPSVNYQAEQKEVVKVSADTLVKEYEANEVSADAKFKNKTLEVNGTINAIGKDILDTPYITLQGGSNMFLGLQCMFSKSDQSSLINLKKSQKITVRGEVSGKLGNVLLNDCSVVTTSN